MTLPAHIQPAALALPQAGLAPPPPVTTFGVSAEQKLELLEYWRSVIKRKWLILGLALAVAVLAAVVAMAMTPVFSSTATVLIESGKGKILSVDDIYQLNPQAQREHYQTQVEVIKSREVAERTVRTLKLQDNPAFDIRQMPPSIKQRALGMLGVADDKEPPTEDDAVAYAANVLLRDMLTVQPVRLSQLVKVTVEGTSANQAASIANALVNEYIGSDRDKRIEMSEGVSNLLEQRLSALRERLVQSEEALQKYREEKGIVSIGGSSQVLSSQQLSSTSEKVVAARAKRLELESRYQQLRALGGRDLATLPWITQYPTVESAMRTQSDAQRRLAEAQQSLGAQHPKVVQLQTEVNETSGTLSRAMADAASSVMREYENARSTEQSMERALNSARGEAQGVNREEFQLSILERDVLTNRQLYEMFTNRAKETSLTGDVYLSVARVVDAAIPAKSPIKPKRFQIVVVATFLALLLGALASVVLDRIDNTVKGGEDAELRLKQPLLAAFPAVEGIEPGKMSRMYLDDPHSHFAEAVRTARTGVLLSNLDAPHKILLITSSLPGEGKTTVSVNLALAHAQTKKTLLIDCDMRRSQVSRALNMPPGKHGLSNLVAGTAPEAACFHQVTDSALTVLPVGDIPPNPLELMLSQRFKDLIRRLSDEYEMIIIDSPPVELVSEALVLAPMAHSTAFVVKAMSTPAPLVRKNLMRLQRAGANILGVVVNQLDFRHARLYYGEYGASSYNYGGYGYGASEGGKLTYGAAATQAAAKKNA